MPPEKKKIDNETQKHRWDRNFADLLQELRVAQTGVQILFAFLLTLPFSNGFGHISSFQKDVYVVALLAAAFAAAMIIAPVAFHRALFRQGRKPELVRYAHKMTTGGLVFTLVSMISCILLITDYLLNIVVATILTAATTVWFVIFWAAIPMFKHKWIDEDDEEQDEAVSGEIVSSRDG